MSQPPPTKTEETPQATAVAPTTSDSTMPPAPAPTAADAGASRDVAMLDAPEQSSSPAPAVQGAPGAPGAPSPAAPARTGTPSRNLNGEASSRAGSVLPDANANTLNFPAQASAHGDSARMYINGTVTSALLEGMKIIGKNQPPNPLKVLGEFLIEKSRERGEPST